VAGAACENSRFALHQTMDTEQINAIGTLLADLSDRTQQLRGYL
jgi:CHASE3 domain sensor protein